MKHRIINIVILLALALIFPAALMAQMPGKYEVVPPNQPPAAHSLDKVHVQEVFSFGCPHCFTLNQQMNLIKKEFGDKLVVSYVPIGWLGHDPGRLLYIAEEKGKQDQVKDLIFDFYHIKGLGKSVYSRDKLQFVAKMTGLTEEFKTRMDAPEIAKKMNDGIAFTQAYEINSTPTLVIEGSIKVSGNPGNFIAIVNYLLKEPIEFKSNKAK